MYNHMDFWVRWLCLLRVMRLAGRHVVSGFVKVSHAWTPWIQDMMRCVEARYLQC